MPFPFFESKHSRNTDASFQAQRYPWGIPIPLDTRPSALGPTITNAARPLPMNPLPSIPGAIPPAPARPLPLVDSRFPFEHNPLPYPNVRPAPPGIRLTNEDVYGVTSQRADSGYPQSGPFLSEADVRHRRGAGQTYGSGQGQGQALGYEYGGRDELERVMLPGWGQAQGLSSYGTSSLPLTAAQRAEYQFTGQNQPDAWFRLPVPLPSPAPIPVPSAPPLSTGEPLPIISTPFRPTRVEGGSTLTCLRCGESCDDLSNRYAYTCHAQRRYYHPQYVVDTWVHASPAIGRAHAGHKMKPELERDGQVGGVVEKDNEEKDNEHGNQLRVFKVFALFLSLMGGVLLIAHHTRQVHDIASPPQEINHDPSLSSSTGSLYPKRTDTTRIKQKARQMENTVNSEIEREAESESGMLLELLSDIAVPLGGLVLLLNSLFGLWRQYHPSSASPSLSSNTSTTTTTTTATTTYICALCMKPWSDTDTNGCRYGWGCCIVRTESDDIKDTGCRPIYRCGSCSNSVEEKGCQSRCLSCGTRWIGNRAETQGRRECLSPARHVY